MAAHEIDYAISGDYAPMLTVTLDPGEAVQAEAGALVMMDDGISMETEMAGGFFGGLMRKVSGESFFLPFFENKADGRRDVCFASPLPGQIKAIDLTQTGGEFYLQRDAYLCSAKGVEISIALTKKLSSGLFGGEGFVLQKLTGDGLAFLGAGGSLIERDLAAGQSVSIDTGCVVGFSTTCDYDIYLQKGIKNLLFGGEGLFMTRVTGPGKVFLQTQPISELALNLARYLPFPKD